MFHGSSPAGDWAALLERLDRTGAFPRWQGQEAALAAVPCLADLPSHTGRGAERAAADRIMGALVRIAAVDGRDDTDAALVLVHLLRIPAAPNDGNPQTLLPTLREAAPPGH